MELVVDYKNFKKGSLTQERIDEFKEIAKRNLKKHPTAVADLKHWNNKGDDYDYTYYRLKDGELTEVHDF